MADAMVNVPETAAKGEIVQIKILISHPMETGFRPRADGSLIPRDIIHELRCLYRGEEVFRAELFPAISANPFFAFPLRADASGEVTLVWINEQGAETRQSRRIKVV